jgi:hypothetical protein
VEIMNAVLYAAGAVSCLILFFMGITKLEELSKIYSLINIISLVIGSLGFAMAVVVILLVVVLALRDWLKENWDKAEYEAVQREKEAAQITTHRDPHQYSVNNVRERKHYE